MNFDIANKTILLSLAGSHSYGMATPESDVDVRGIAIAPLNIRISSFHRFEQYEGVWVDGLNDLRGFNSARYTEIGGHDIYPEDVVIYDIAKAIKLIGECNPNMLEILFCDEKDYLFVGPLGQKLIDVREKFLTLRAKPRYVGYARSQLAKIERHRGYLLGGIPKKPTRSEYNLPEHESLIPQAERNLIDEEVKNKIREWSADNIEMGDAERITLSENLHSFMCATLKVSGKELDEKLEDTAADSLGFDQNIREILRRERGYRNALKSFKSYEKWEKERNPKRKALEEKFGFDTKHASHLIRLCRMGVEILRDGELKVRRDDADELLAIRRGERDFDSIQAEAGVLFGGIEQFYKENPKNLPKKMDSDFLDSLTREIVLMSLR